MSREEFLIAIEELTDEEFADMMVEGMNCKHCPLYDTCGYNRDCKLIVLKALKEGEDH